MLRERCQKFVLSGPRDQKLLPVHQTAPVLHAVHRIQIDEIAFVAAEKANRRKLLLAVLHLSALPVVSAFCVENQVVPFTFNIVDIFCDDPVYAGRAVHRHSMHIIFRKAVDCPLQLLREREIRDRLHYIIKSVHLIAPDRVLHHIGDKHDDDLLIERSDLFGRCHPVHELHLNVHQNDVILRLIRNRNIFSVAEKGQPDLFAGFLHEAVHIFCQLVRVQLLIFYNRDPDHAVSSRFCSAWHFCPVRAGASAR